MSQTMDRRVVLGGEARGRGLITGYRNRLEWIGMLLTAAPLLLVLTGGELGWLQLAQAAVIAVAAFGLWTPFPGLLRNRSVMAWLAGEARFLVHRHREGMWVPPHVGGDDASAFNTPEAVGHTVMAQVRLPSGEELAVLRHINPGRAHFFTVAFEMVGTTGGIEGEWAFGQAHEAWGRFCSTLARSSSYIRTVQQITRVVPYDTADHSVWVMDRLPQGASHDLTTSYVELLDAAAVRTEQHRTWLVLRIPVTTSFSVAAAMIERSEAGELALVESEVTGAIQRAVTHGMAVRPLDEARLAAVIRSLQDPDRPIDQIRDMTFDRAWAPLNSRHRRHLVVHGDAGQWLTRTAVVPTHGIEPGRFSPDFLHPLVSDVSPAVVRTISTVIDLIPAHDARMRAKKDVTLDAGAQREAASRVSDGSEEEQFDASSQRLRDLRAGTGNHGAGWGMSITFCARTPQELDAASRRLEDAADAAHITDLYYLNGRHDAGLVASLPLGRGLEVRK